MKNIGLILSFLVFMPFSKAQDAIISFANVSKSGNEVTFEVLLTPASISPIYLGNFDVLINFPGNTVSSSIAPVRVALAQLPNSNGALIDVKGEIAANGRAINFEPSNLESQSDFANNIAKVSSMVTLGTYKITFNPPFTGTLNCGSHLVYTFSNTSTWAQSNIPVIGCTNVNTTDATVTVSMKAILQGPYDVATGKMKDDLRVKNLIPTSTPYVTASPSLPGFTHFGGGGSETTTPSVLAVTGDNAIVDWVFIELRDATTPATVLHTRSALLQVDGDIVDVDGVSAVKFMTADASKTYFIALKHRNHLGARTNTAVKPSSVGLNFSTASPVISYGTEALKPLGSGKMGLWAGNVNQDGAIKYLGANNDRLPIYNRIGSASLTAMVNGYYKEDVNMDGVVKYLGQNNDRLIIYISIGAASLIVTRTEQF
jgi:hypothetical protein